VKLEDDILTDADSGLDEICRPITFDDDIGDEMSLDVVSEELEEEGGFAEDDGAGCVKATGQRLQTCKTSSQYKSTSNLRKPTASKFERHKVASSSSNFSLEKQADDRETPGVVTKLLAEKLVLLT